MSRKIHAARKMEMTDGSRRFYGQTVCGKPLGQVGLPYVTDDPSAVTCSRCRGGLAWPFFYSRWLNA